MPYKVIDTSNLQIRCHYMIFIHKITRDSETLLVETGHVEGLHSVENTLCTSGRSDVEPLSQDSLLLIRQEGVDYATDLAEDSIGQTIFALLQGKVDSALYNWYKRSMSESTLHLVEADRHKNQVESTNIWQNSRLHIEAECQSLHSKDRIVVQNTHQRVQVSCVESTSGRLSTKNRQDSCVEST